jgi:hypothetical protein
MLWRLLRGQPPGRPCRAPAGFLCPQAPRYDAFRERLLHGRVELITAWRSRRGAHRRTRRGTGSNLERMGSRVESQSGRCATGGPLSLLALESPGSAPRTDANVEVIAADADDLATRCSRSTGLPVVFADHDARLARGSGQCRGHAGARRPPRRGRFPSAGVGRPWPGFWRRWFSPRWRASFGGPSAGAACPASPRCTAEQACRRALSARAAGPYYSMFVGKMPVLKCTPIRDRLMVFDADGTVPSMPSQAIESAFPGMAWISATWSASRSAATCSNTSAAARVPAQPDQALRQAKPQGSCSPR